MTRPEATFTSPADPTAVAAYLADPRNLVIANNKRPIVDQSDDGPTATGSWYVLKLDQLRLRVEYVAFDPPTRIDVEIVSSGFGSAGYRQRVEYRLAPDSTGTGTTITQEGEGRGGIPILGRLMAGLVRRRMQRRFDSIPPTPPST